MANKYNADSITLLYADGGRGALSNICHGNGRNKFATVIDLKDAVEDSTDAKSLLANIRSLNLIGMDDLRIDRDVLTYTRLIGRDALGNIHYLKIGKGV